MKKMILRAAGAALCSLLLLPALARAGQYTNFEVSTYITVGGVRSLGNPETLTNQWNRIRSQLKVDKVYLEVQRNRESTTRNAGAREKVFPGPRGEGRRRHGGIRRQHRRPVQVLLLHRPGRPRVRSERGGTGRPPF